jgi:hypothetical protein
VNNGNFEFHQTLATAMGKQNFNLQAITAATSELESAGFINVRERVLKMPIGGWHDDPELKEIGGTFRLVMKESIPEIGMRVIQENLWLELGTNDGIRWQGKGELGSSIPDIFSVAHRYWPETGLINQPRGG